MPMVSPLPLGSPQELHEARGTTSSHHRSGVFPRSVTALSPREAWPRFGGRGAFSVSILLNVVLAAILFFRLSNSAFSSEHAGGPLLANVASSPAPPASLHITVPEAHCTCNCICPAAAPACSNGTAGSCPACLSLPTALPSAANCTGTGVAIAIPPFPAAARFSDPATHCKRNPYISRWKAADYQKAASALVQFRATQVNAVQGVGWHADGHARFNAIPAIQPCPDGLVRYGEGDGGKFICGLPTLQPGCIIYSLGSAYDFGFENQMVALTPCEVYTFDCTVDPRSDRFPKSLDARIHFYSLCLGKDKPPSYSSLRTITQRFNHSVIHLLKFDVEGFEYQIVESMLATYMDDPSTPLPMQLSFELHHFAIALGPDKLPWTINQAMGGLSTGDISVLWTALTDLGYSIVSREDNPKCNVCSEFTVVRSFCA